jgi:hypothetical protein
MPLGAGPLSALIGQWQLLFTTFFPLVVLFALTDALGEEPGWRGFALPRLQQRFGPVLGTIVLGTLHSLWHVPTGFVVGGTLYPFALTTFVTFVLTGIAGSFIYTWIYNHCAGYSGHLFSKSVLEGQGIVVVVRQALFKRMSLVASTPSCRQIGASDTCGNMRDEQAGSLSFRADSAHLFTFCAHSVLISTQRRAALLVSYTLAESPATKT